MIVKWVDDIGEYGPVILFASSLTLLALKKTYFIYYLFGSIINALINIVLKFLIRQPRPLEKREVGNYGMPSGHAQHVFFSLTFIFLVFRKDKNHSILLFYLLYILLAINTVRQRVKFQFHTLLQVVAGSIVGACVGYLFYYMAVKKTIGLLKYKLDDNAPI
jgi:membrane-associated phospholipid phosphatase